MAGRLELRDLRSLERTSMYSIFHPLDPDERLPGELLLEGRRQRLREIGAPLGWIGFIYLLLLVVLVLGSIGVNAAIALGVAALGLLIVYGYVVSSKSR